MGLFQFFFPLHGWMAPKSFRKNFARGSTGFVWYELTVEAQNFTIGAPLQPQKKLIQQIM
jgi:hypothetical protein